MTQQLTLDDLVPTGEELRDGGIRSLERHPWIAKARNLAEFICRSRGTVTTDDLHPVLPPAPHPNCFGAIWSGKRFAWTGQYIKSARREAHYRDIKVWRLA